MRAVLAMLLALGPAAACSDARADTLDPADCVASSGTMQQDLCQAAEYDRLDIVLGHALQAANERLAAGASCISACDQALHALDQAQEAWIVFRDNDCEAAYAIAIDGSGRNSARLDCLIEHTRIRTGQLQRL
ncbi:lysozyme inhibitor LprI family protein [Xanthomonas sp. XNM01]|uniref:lysozyme inhibitor LprI family protein n=1 Tax=Xanthomonas sp. XNM01 TaxID=2769289 RepID=UPI001782C62C|nr:DUF1311 domain-containing protein [Xanthomonas sp. XNM01]